MHIRLRYGRGSIRKLQVARRMNRRRFGRIQSMLRSLVVVQAMLTFFGIVAVVPCVSKGWRQLSGACLASGNQICTFSTIEVYGTTSTLKDLVSSVLRPGHLTMLFQCASKPHLETGEESFCDH